MKNQENKFGTPVSSGHPHISADTLTHGLIEDAVFTHSFDTNISEFGSILATNVHKLPILLMNNRTTLMMFMWINFASARYNSNRPFGKKPSSLQEYLPNAIFAALLNHGWLESYANDTMTKHYRSLFQGSDYIKIDNRQIPVELLVLEFERNLCNMFACLNTENRQQFQQIIPIERAGYLLSRNFKGDLSLNEYLPLINRLNRYFDISCLIHAQTALMDDLPPAVRSMLSEFQQNKNPANFPILWERLAGHPKYGQLCDTLGKRIDAMLLNRTNQTLKGFTSDRTK